MGIYSKSTSGEYAAGTCSPIELRPVCLAGQFTYSQLISFNFKSFDLELIFEIAFGRERQRKAEKEAGSETESESFWMIIRIFGSCG